MELELLKKLCNQTSLKNEKKTKFSSFAKKNREK